MIADQLVCQLEESFEGLEALRQQWDETVLRVDSSVYMSYDWTRVWWQFYGKGRELRLFVFRSGERIVGVVPTYIDSIGLRPLQFRLARLVGAYVPPKVFNPPIESEWAKEVWRAVITHLFTKDECDLISLGPISENHKSAEGIRQACREVPGLVAGCNTVHRDVHTVYDLPATYDQYFSSLDSKERKVRRKKLRDLEASWPLRTEVVREPAAVEQEFESFAGQHARQWLEEGRPGHFHAWPNGLDYNRTLVRTHGALDRVRFFKLMAGDHVVANQYTFAFGKTVFAELPARITGAEWHRFSLGCTSQIKLIEAAIQEGFQRMDSGLGHYEYKILTGGRESRADVIRILRRSVRSRAALVGCGAGRTLTQLILQKAWYRRIMPRLPEAFRGGQSRLALRFDY